MEVVALLDSNITLDRKSIDPVVAEQIFNALSIPNPEKVFAKKEKIGGWWNLPDQIFLFQADDDRIILPRGFADQLLQGLRDGVRWIDKRSANKPIVFSKTAINIRDYQSEAIEELKRREQGIWQSPPGSGKTVTILELIRRLGQKSVVIVNSANIAEQWRERSRSFLDYEPGLFGDSIREEKDFTICLQQTLWSQRDELQKEGWFDQWGLICLDECHHLPANTFTDILSRFPAYFRFGVSGTPFKQKEFEEIVLSTVGPLVLKTEKDRLIKEKWLIKPSVEVHQTKFKRNFCSTHTNRLEIAKVLDACSEFSFCARDITKKRHQNNYADIITELIHDDHRNDIIAKQIAKDLNEGHTTLVLSRRLEHLTNLYERVSRQAGEDNLFYFTGKQSTVDRMVIQTRADSGSCVLFSTIADEALDIPRASRLHLAYPTKNTDIIRQQIGRIERPHPNKKDAKLHDYLDDVGPLRRQFEDRLYGVYDVDKLETFVL